MLSLMAARSRINHQSHSEPVIYPLTLVNAVGPVNTTGWTNLTGALLVRSGYFFSQSATLRAYQDVDIPDEILPFVEAGQAFAIVEWNPGGFGTADHDNGEIEVISLDAASSILSTSPSGLISWTLSPTPTYRQNTAAPIPSGAKKIRVQMHAVRAAGTDNNAYFDDLALSILVTQKRKAWRLYITANNGGAFHQAFQIDFRGTSGGESLAKYGTPFASSIYAGAVPPYTPVLAFNGNTDIVTYQDEWASANGSGSSPGYIGYILPGTDQINEVAFWNRLGSSGSVTSAPKDFIIQSSLDTTDGTDGTWQNEWEVTGQTGWSAGELRTFTRP
jgi:hypothetical protein